MDKGSYDQMAAVEDRHWWYVGMRATAEALLEASGGISGSLLDAGCGTGGWLARLGTAGSLRSFGVDAELYPLLLASGRGAGAVLAAAVERLPYRDGTFDLVTCIDVLYHQGVTSDAAALTELHRVLHRGGRLLLQLPAHDWLRSRHDTAVHTRERYSAPRVRALLEGTGFEVERLTYANALLFPLAVAWRLLDRFRSRGRDVEVAVPPRLLNRLALGALAVERRWLARADLPLGLSVLALARR